MEIITKASYKATNIIDKHKQDIYSEARAIKDISWKLKLLTDAAKYDVACTSSGVERKDNGRDMDNMNCNHFADRFPAENWIIYDATHHIVAVHPRFSQWFLTDDSYADFDNIDKMSYDTYVDLWKLFVETIAIEERKNEKCQNSHLPKWYRKNLTEWK